MLTVDFAICTYTPEGIRRVEKMLPSPAEGVRYVVSWQKHQGTEVPPYLLTRRDVEVLRFEGSGLSRNRNNALDHCRGDIIIFADDDITLYPEEIDKLRQYMEEHTDVDVVTFRSDHGDLSRFPPKETSLNGGNPRGYWVSSIEIALRRTSAGHLRLCPELGIGAPRLHGGEDEALLLSAIHRGLSCRFVPLTLCAHPDESTGNRSHFSRGQLMAFGCVSALMYPVSWLLRIPLKAWRIFRGHQAPLASALWWLTKGALAAGPLRRRNPDTLW